MPFVFRKALTVYCGAPAGEKGFVSFSFRMLLSRGGEDTKMPDTGGIEEIMGRREQREQIFKLLFRVEFNPKEEMPEQCQLFLRMRKMA